MRIFKPMLLFFIAILVVTSMVSSAEWDNSLSVEPTGNEYPILHIDNWFGFGTRLATMELLENDRDCFIDCFATINITLNTPMTLFDDVSFVTKKSGRQYKEHNIYYWNESPDVDRFKIP